MAAGDGGYFQTGVTPEEFFPYAPRTGNKSWAVANTGVCDPTMGDTRERLVPQRTATGFFRGTMAGAGANIVFNTTSVLLFTQGPTDNAQAAGGGATGLLARSDTNAQSGTNGGGVARADQAFVATGMWFQFQEVYCVAANAAPVGDTRVGSAFLRSPVSPYDRIIQQLLGPVLNPRLKNGKDAACEFDLLAADVWPQSSGMSSQPIGFGGIGASFLQLAVPQVSGGQGTGKELQVTIVQDRIVSIESDAANPTPGAGVDVICPIRCVMVGFPICATPGVAVADTRVVAAEVFRMMKADGMGMGGSYDQATIDAAEKVLKNAGRMR